MATIRKLKEGSLSKHSSHTEVDATYSLFSTAEGPFLQIDTYGSKDRKLVGKKSQTIRFSPESLIVLKDILKSIKI